MDNTSKQKNDNCIFVLKKYNPKSANRKSNESLPDTQIHMPIKPVKHKM